MENYNSIKKNIIDNYLNPGYRYSTVSNKKMVAGRINDQSWFPVSYDSDARTLNFELGDGVVVVIECVWEEKKIGELTYYHVKEFK